MKKFTFKKHKKEGSYRSFQKDYTDVKLSGNKVGWITEREYEKYELWFSVKSTEHTCGWKNIKLKAEFKNEKDAREFITTNAAKLQEKFELHQHID